MGTTHQPLTDFDLLLLLQEVGLKIGRTSVHAVRNVFRHPRVTVHAKMEWEQLSGSVKARAAYNIIYSAIQSGALNCNKTLLDATSGNTGIAYAAICRELGIQVTLCLPENASAERKNLLVALGADIIFTSKFEGTDGAQQVARELAVKYPDRYFYADQYSNDGNWKAHYHHTALEIIQSFPQISHFVAGLGTTGTFTGTGRRLKEYDRRIQLVGLQPDSALHGMEGWKHLETAVVPPIYDEHLADGFLELDTAEVYDMMKKALRMEGLRLSPSSAANLLGAIRMAETLESGTVVTVFPDNADKYGDLLTQLDI